MQVKPLGIDTDCCLIDGVWTSSDVVDHLTLVNPSTGDALCDIAAGNVSTIDAAVGAARRAADGVWARVTAVERGRFLARIGALVLENMDHLAELEALDVGKPLKQALADVVALSLIHI